MTGPGWVEHAIWWQVYPLGFVGAETGSAGVGVTHRLGRVAGWLDHAVALGASGIALRPVFASTTHGYDTTDPYRIDPRLGDDADFVALVEAAHGRGLRVLLDGVFNHVRPEFVAPSPSWYRGDGHGGQATFEGHPGLRRRAGVPRRQGGAGGRRRRRAPRVPGRGPGRAVPARTVAR